MTAVDANHPYLALMNDVEREQRWANQRPRDAATMIIIDRSGKKPTVLMGKRHAGHKFMFNARLCHARVVWHWQRSVRHSRKPV